MTATAIDVVLFSIGQWRMGVEAQQVRASHSAAQTLPSTHDVVLLSSLLGLPTASAPVQLLQIKQATKDHAVQVNSPVDITSIPAQAIHPLPALLAARTQLPGLRALALDKHGLTLLLDLAAVLETA